MPSRAAAKFAFEIHDWDRVGTSTVLGTGPIDLQNITPFDVTNLELPVIPPKGGKEGSLSLQLRFQPESE